MLNLCPTFDEGREESRNNVKADRRIERTRNRLREALYALIIERGYDTITVQQIIDRAQVARSSFYAHFRDKDDLLLSGFSAEVSDAVGGRMFDPSAPAGAYPDFGYVLFKSALVHKIMVCALFSGDANSVSLNHLRNVLVVHFRDWMREHHDGRSHDRQIELAVQYIANALIGLLVWWAHNDFECPLEEISGTFRRMTDAGLRELLPLGDVCAAS